MRAGGEVGMKEYIVQAIAQETIDSFDAHNAPELVRCKDCKHRPTQTEPPKTYGFSIEFPEGSKCPCECGDGFYSWYPNDDWYCADGEQKEVK